MATYVPFPKPGGTGGGDYDDTALRARVSAGETTNRTQDVTLDDHGRRILSIEETPPIDLDPLTERVATLETAGVEGPAGADGAPGRDGVDGLPGRDGTDGLDGQPGVQGLPGRDGVDGAPGRDGLDGAAGRDGVDGLPGVQGVPGADGVDGAPGQRGERGPAGSDAPAYDDSDLTLRMGEVESDFAAIETAFESEIDARAEGDRVLGVRVTALEDGGVEGPAGPEGPAGANGMDGADGAAGPQGPEGPAGQDGIDGAPGVAGERGPAGADGVAGPEGPVGPVGPAGADGSPGADGAVGPQGQVGPAGQDGVNGVDGQDGAIGPEGPIGPAGRDGVDGQNGVDGLPGADGAAGPQGPEGPAGRDGIDGLNGQDGADGLPGADGAAGPQGPVGPAGQDGTNGIDGAPGTQGPQGLPGGDGAIGPEGPAGRDGVDGVDGQNGVDGAAGPQGPAGPVGPEGPIGPQGPAGSGSGGSNAAVTESRPWIVYLPVSDDNATAITLRAAGIIAGDQLVVRGDLPNGPIDETLTVADEVLDDPVYDWLSNLQSIGFLPLVLQADAVEIDGQVIVSPRLGIAIALGATAPSEAFSVEFTGGVAEALSRGGDTVATFATFPAGRTTDVYDPVGQRDLAETLGVLRADVGEVLPIGNGQVIRTGLTQRVHDLEQAGGTVCPAGPQGPEGPQGAQGVQGERGLPGADGARGADGAQGAKGDQGIQGLQGVKGETGTRGTDGAQGPQGPQGPAGSSPHLLGKVRRKTSEADTLLSTLAPAGTKEFVIVSGGGAPSGVAVYQDGSTPAAHGGIPPKILSSGRLPYSDGLKLTTIVGSGGAKATSGAVSVANQNAGSPTSVTVKRPDGSTLYDVISPAGPTWMSLVLGYTYMASHAVYAYLRPQLDDPNTARPGLSNGHETGVAANQNASGALNGPGAGAGANRRASILASYGGGNGSSIRVTYTVEYPYSEVVPGGLGSGTNGSVAASAGTNPRPDEAGSWGSGGGGGHQFQNAVPAPGGDGAFPCGAGGGCATAPPNSGSPLAAVSGAGAAGVVDIYFYGA